MNLYKYGLNFLQKATPKYDLKSSTIGVITATDSNTFIGVQTLFSSIKDKINFLCYDLGLKEEEIAWCKENNLELKKIELPGCKHIKKWQTYVKPWLVDDSPFEYTVWIDSDCVVVGDLSKSKFIQNKESFFIKHWIQQKYLTKNSKFLYLNHPVENPSCNYVNAGVFGINKSLNQDILDKWKFLLETGFKDKEFLDLIVNWDEGGLNWALQNKDNFKYIHNDYRYNGYASFLIDVSRHNFSIYEQKILTLDKSASPSLFFKHVLDKSKDFFILHFSTCMENKKKYWGAWAS